MRSYAYIITGLFPPPLTLSRLNLHDHQQPFRARLSLDETNESDHALRLPPCKHRIAVERNEVRASSASGDSAAVAIVKATGKLSGDKRDA